MRPIAFFAAPLLVLLYAAGPAHSATLTATASLEISLGTLPPVVITAAPISVAVSSGTGAFVLPAGLLVGSTHLPYELFTGVSLISSLNLSASNQTLTQLGGAATGSVSGQILLGVTGGLVNLIIPLALAGGTDGLFGAAALAITVTNGTGWTTGAVSVTGITSQTTSGGFVNTVFATGADTRTAAHAGTISLVTPTRVLTNATGNLPLFATLKVVFTTTPEPALQLMLLGSAMLGYAAIRRRP